MLLRASTRYLEKIQSPYPFFRTAFRLKVADLIMWMALEVAKVFLENTEYFFSVLGNLIQYLDLDILKTRSDSCWRQNRMAELTKSTTGLKASVVFAV